MNSAQGALALLAADGGGGPDIGDAVYSAEPPATLAAPESFDGDRRHGGAIGRLVHGSRQGADLARAA